MTIRLAWGLLAVLACASCATTDRPAATAASEEQFRAKYTSPTSDTATPSAQDLADQQIVCDREPRTASHLRRPRCYTRLELERMNRQSRGVTQRALKN
jgi:hypothetical protein